MTCGCRGAARPGGWPPRPQPAPGRAGAARLCSNRLGPDPNAVRCSSRFDQISLSRRGEAKGLRHPARSALKAVMSRGSGAPPRLPRPPGCLESL